MRSSVTAPLDQENVYVPAGMTVSAIDPLGLTQEVFAEGKAVVEKLLLIFRTLMVSKAWQPEIVSLTITE